MICDADGPGPGDPTPDEIAQRAAAIRAAWLAEADGLKRPGSSIGRREQDDAPGIREYFGSDLDLPPGWRS